MASETGKCVMEAPPEPAEGLDESTDDTMVLGAAEILNMQDLGVVLVDVPEWGGQVFVRQISGTERDEFEARQQWRNRQCACADDTEEAAVDRLNNFRARVAALTLADSKGKALFTEEQVEALGEKNGAALDRVFDVACRMNGLYQADIEDLVKNSGSGRNADSGSASA